MLKVGWVKKKKPAYVGKVHVLQIYIGTMLVFYLENIFAQLFSSNLISINFNNELIVFRV